MTKVEQKKLNEYAAKIHDHLMELFKDECENRIEPKELEEHGTVFFHALATLAPGLLYNMLTSSDLNSLEFNHIANRLCFQYSNDADA